jgi:hypothetical protein
MFWGKKCLSAVNKIFAGTAEGIAICGSLQDISARKRTECTKVNTGLALKCESVPKIINSWV